MKHLHMLPLSLLALLAASCGGKSDNPEAVALLNSADAAFSAGNPGLAISLLDSLQHAFPSEINVQRKAMELRPRAIELEAQRGIAAVDSMTVADRRVAESLKPQMKWVKTPGMIEGYYIYGKAYNPSFMNTTGIEARVNEIGQFYIVSSLNPSGKTHHEAISLTCGGETVSTPVVKFDGESNYRISGGEVITFSPEQSDTLGVFAAERLAANPSAPMTLNFVGSGSRSIRLSTDQAQGIAAAYRYSQAIIRARDNEVERKRLLKTIEIARRQAAVASNPREEE